MKRPQILAGLVAALLALSAGSAAAQLYKWVDERGVVNYSNQLPADAKSASQAAAVEDRVSVYTPDPALLSKIETDRLRSNQAATEKPEPWQPAVAMLGTPGAAPLPAVSYEPYAAVYPSWPTGYWPHRPRPLHAIPQVKLPAGAIAGNTVGLYSIMPGSSSPVPGTWSPVAPQQPVPNRPSYPRPWPYDYWRR